VASGSATVAIVYLIVKTITKTQWIAITAAFVFGFSFSFWRNAEIVDIYIQLFMDKSLLPLPGKNFY
jgi:dolichyl-phosphate-mannose--protein O-mannosyl transferase